MSGERVCVGAISGVHGVRGDVRIKPFTETPEAVAEYGVLETEDKDRTFEIVRFRVAKGIVVATLKGITSRNVAETLRGTRLYVPRSRLPAPDEGEFYHSDLIGIHAHLEDGTPVGTITAVHDFGAGDLLEITLADGGDALYLPFTLAIVPNVDLTKGVATIIPPEEVE